MTEPYDYPHVFLPVSVDLKQQTDEQLEKNYAVTSQNTYELSDEQRDEICRVLEGTGLTFTEPMVLGRPVRINGENLIHLKNKGSHQLVSAKGPLEV